MADLSYFELRTLVNGERLALRFDEEAELDAFLELLDPDLEVEIVKVARHQAGDIQKEENL